jgi:hypothetical protein
MPSLHAAFRKRHPFSIKPANPFSSQPWPKPPKQPPVPSIAERERGPTPARTPSAWLKPGQPTYNRKPATAGGGLQAAFRKRQLRLHDTPKSPHKEHGPKGKHQVAGQAVHAGRFQPVSTEEGAKALQQAYRDNPRAWNLTPHSAEDLKGSRVFLSHGGKAGFVITADGELQNVFNNSGTKGLGAAGVKRAIAEGARNLDAYDGFLTPFYEKLGFRETGRAKFDPKYAPPNLPKEIAAKKPDVVFMEYAGK